MASSCEMSSDWIEWNKNASDYFGADVWVWDQMELIHKESMQGDDECVSYDIFAMIQRILTTIFRLPTASAKQKYF